MKDEIQICPFVRMYSVFKNYYPNLALLYRFKYCVHSDSQDSFYDTGNKTTDDRELWFLFQIRLMSKSGRTDKLAVCVGTVTDDMRVFKVPKLKVNMLIYTYIPIRPNKKNSMFPITCWKKIG